MTHPITVLPTGNGILLGGMAIAFALYLGLSGIADAVRQLSKRPR